MRPYFLILIVLVFTSCNINNSRSVYISSNFELIELAKGVYASIHKPGGKAICNVGIIDNGEETIIFDSFLSPEAAEEIPRIIQHHQLSPVKYVINSHYHNDHIRGNQVFSEEVKIISTIRTAQLIAEKEPVEIADEKVYAPPRRAYYDSLYHAFKGDKNDNEFEKILMWKSYYEVLAFSHEDIITRVPDQLVDEVTFLNGKDRSIQLISRGKGHTESDMVLYLPDDGILFTGDLVFNKCHPYLAHGSLHEWKSWLSYLHELKPSIVIPGHGSPGDTSVILSMASYIEDIEKIATQLHDPNHISTDLIPSKYEDWWFDRFFPVNLTFAYEQKMPDPAVLFQSFNKDIASNPASHELILSDKYQPLVRYPQFRSQVRKSLKKYSTDHVATMIREDEPGTRISVTCRVIDNDTDQPVKDVSVELVQADVHGLYFVEMSNWNPRIFAYLVTDPSGGIAVNTLFPGKYYGNDGSLIPSHMHFTLEKEGYHTYAAEFIFEDDPIYLKNGNPKNLPVARKIADFQYSVTIKMRKDRQQQ